MLATEAKQSTIKFFLLSIASAVLTLLGVVFFSAPLLRVLRNQFGPKLFWTMGLFIFVSLFALGLVPVAFFIGTTWLVVGLYSEIEERGHANFLTAFSVVSLGTIVVIVGPLLWAKFVGVDLSAILSDGVNQLLGQLQNNKTLTSETSLLGGVKIDANLIISQVPSAMFILHLTSLAFALMLDRKIASIVGLRFEKIASQIRLLEFRAPDFLIWITILSFLFSFMKLGNETVTIVAMNLFNALLAIYFFQGLAVLEVLLLVFRAGTITRLIVYFFIVGQLFLLLSLVGVVDFWVDIRKRLRKKSINKNNQNNGEHI